MNKKQLIADVQDQLLTNLDYPITKKEIRQILETALDSIISAIKNGDTVTLLNLGTFKSTVLPPRKGHNPITREEIQLPKTRVVRFKATPSFKKYINS